MVQFLNENAHNHDESTSVGHQGSQQLCRSGQPIPAARAAVMIALLRSRVERARQRSEQYVAISRPSKGWWH
jgi:hypothetical protein